VTVRFWQKQFLAKAQARTTQLLKLMKATVLLCDYEFMDLTAHPCKPGTLALAMEAGVYHDMLHALIDYWLRFFSCVTDDYAINAQLKNARVFSRQ